MTAKNDMLKISVIIPAYNCEKYLDKAVISALNQQQVGEVILVEDGSQDDTLKIAKKLEQSHPKVKLFRHPSGLNKGAGASRNLGILSSNEPLIAFLDADDFYLDNRFVADCDTLTKNPAVDGVYSAIGTEFLDEVGKARYENVGWNENSLTTMKGTVDPGQLFFEMGPIGHKGYFHGNGLTVRRQVFKRVGLFNESLKLSQDTEMWMKLAIKCTLVPGSLDKPVAVRGVHAANRIGDTNKFLHYRPLLYLSLLNWAEKNHVIYPIRNILLSHYLSWALKRDGDGPHEVLKFLVSNLKCLRYTHFYTDLIQYYYNKLKKMSIHRNR